MLDETDKSILLAVSGGFCSFMIAGIFDKQFYMTYTLMGILFFLALAMAIVYEHQEKPIALQKKWKQFFKNEPALT